MERELLIERTQSDLAAARARARGRVGGRRCAFTAAQESEARRLYETRQMTMDQIAKAVGSSSPTVYRYPNESASTSEVAQVHVGADRPGSCARTEPDPIS
jgi:DNA invertase Pin-like site-specific DNA recombinase